MKDEKNQGAREYDRNDFLSDLKKIAKRSSEGDASRESDSQETPEKSDHKES